MALDGNIDKTVKAPDTASLSSLNLNSVSDQPVKPAQVADDGVFNRTRGQGQPVQGGRAHPFSDTGITMGKDGKLKVGQDPAATPNTYVPFIQHATDEQKQVLDDLGNQQQAQNAAAEGGRVVGNAIQLGFRDNAVKKEDLNKDWDLINVPSTGIGLFSKASVLASAFTMGVFARGIKQKQYSAESASTEKVVDKHIEDVKAIQKKVGDELKKVELDPSKIEETKALHGKYNFLEKYVKKAPNDKLDILVKLNKDHPGVFTEEEKVPLKALAESEAKLATANKWLNSGSEMSKFTRAFEGGKTGLKQGFTFIAGSVGINYAIKTAWDQLPGDDHHEADRIFTQTTQESFFEGIIGASPIRSLKAKIGVGAAAWLAGREEKMTTGESLLTTAGVMGATAVAGLLPGVRPYVGTALKYEAGAFAAGRLVHMIPGLGSTVPELTNTSTDAWNAMKTDSEKMSGSSFKNAVESFDKLGKNWRGVLAAYQRDVVDNGIGGRTLAIDHGNIELNNWNNVIINGRTGMALSEALGDTTLKSGLTDDTRKDLMGKYFKQTSDEKPESNDMVIAPNQGDLDLTGRAARSYMTAIQTADVTIVNMKNAQADKTDTTGNHVTNADIQAVADERAKIIKEMSDKILRSSPGADAHDIKDIVEGTGGWGPFNTNGFKLTDYAKHDPNAYKHTVDALENKAYAARDKWLPDQAKGTDPELANQYVAKMFRDSAVMRLGFMNYLLTSQDSYSTAPAGKDVVQMKEYLQGSKIGDQVDGPDAKRNTKASVEAALALDPNNPDMKAIVVEYNRTVARVADFRKHYMDTHNGQDPWMDPTANPFGVQKPANSD
jgi:hypothetical protein